MVSDCARKKCLACAWGAVEKYALGLRDTQCLKELRVLDGELDDLRGAEEQRTA